MIRKSGMLNHPYSFDSYAQMGKYMGIYNYGIETKYDSLMRIKVDPSLFHIHHRTEHAGLHGRFLHKPLGNVAPLHDRPGIPLQQQDRQSFSRSGRMVRQLQAPHEVLDAVKVLEQLGY